MSGQTSAGEVTFVFAGAEVLIQRCRSAATDIEDLARRLTGPLASSVQLLGNQPRWDPGHVAVVARWADFMADDLRWRLDAMAVADSHLDAPPPRSWALASQDSGVLLDRLGLDNSDQELTRLLNEIAHRARSEPGLATTALQTMTQRGFAATAKSAAPGRWWPTAEDPRADPREEETTQLRRALGRLVAGALDDSDPPDWLVALVDTDTHNDWLSGQYLLPLLGDTPLPGPTAAALAARYLREAGAQPGADLPPGPLRPNGTYYQTADSQSPLGPPADPAELWILELLDEPEAAFHFLTGPAAPLVFSYFDAPEFDHEIAALVTEGLLDYPNQHCGHPRRVYLALRDTIAQNVHRLKDRPATAEALAGVAVAYLPAMISQHLPSEFQQAAPAHTAAMAPASGAGFFGALLRHDGAGEILAAGVALLSQALTEWAAGADDIAVGHRAVIVADTIVAAHDLLFAGYDNNEVATDKSLLYFMLGQVTDTANIIKPGSGIALAAMAFGLSSFRSDNAAARETAAEFARLTNADGSSVANGNTPAVTAYELMMVNAMLRHGAGLPAPPPRLVRATGSLDLGTDPAAFTDAYHRWKRTWPDAIRAQVAEFLGLLEQHLETAANN